MTAETSVNDMIAGGVAPSERPAVLAAGARVDAEEEQFRRLQCSAAMTMIFNRRRREGGIPSREDVADYEAMVAIIGRVRA